MLVDFEFEVGHGERPVPVCLVARELRSGRAAPVFQNEFGAAPPYAPAPMFYSWPTMPVPSSAAIACLAGRCRNGS